MILKKQFILLINFLAIATNAPSVFATSKIMDCHIKGYSMTVSFKKSMIRNLTIESANKKIELISAYLKNADIYIDDSDIKFYSDTEIQFGSNKQKSISIPTQKFFENIEIYGPYDVEIEQNNNPEITIKADDNILPLIKTQIKEDTKTLVIKHDTETSFITNNIPVINIKLPTISRIKARYCCNIKMVNLQQKHLILDLSVSILEASNLELNSLTANLNCAHITLAGHTQTQIINMKGTCDYNAQKLQSETCILTSPRILPSQQICTLENMSETKRKMLRENKLGKMTAIIQTEELTTTLPHKQLDLNIYKLTRPVELALN